MMRGLRGYGRIGLAWENRQEDRWVRSTLTGDEVLVMSEVEVEFPLADAYAGLEIDTQSV